MRRKRRPHLAKVPDTAGTWGTVPLGGDPPVGPYALADLHAARAAARAWPRGTPRQKRAVRVVMAVLALPIVWGVIERIIGPGG